MRMSVPRFRGPATRILTSFLVVFSFALNPLQAGQAPTPAFAAPIVYTASLSGPAESPSNPSTGTGFTTVTIDVAAHTLRVQVNFSGLISTTTASHIHACTAVPFFGAVGIATQTPTFVNFPLGVSAGTYDRTFDTTDPASWNASFITANGGTPAGAEAALAACLASGRAYLNVHSTLLPGGEIRGFLVESGVGRTLRVTNAPSGVTPPAGVPATNVFRFDWDGPTAGFTQTLTRFTASGQTVVPISANATSVTDTLPTTKEIACWLYKAVDTGGVTRIQGPLYCSQPRDGGSGGPVPNFTIVQTTAASQTQLTGGLAPGATGALIAAFTGTSIRICATFQTQPCTSGGAATGLTVNFVPNVGFNVLDSANGGNPTYYVALEFDASGAVVAQSSIIATFPNSLVVGGLEPDPTSFVAAGSALTAADLLLCHLSIEG